MRSARAGRVLLPEGALGALVLAPQPCGGLLAAVPAASAEGCVAALRAEGHPAAVIGWVTEAPG